MPRLHYPISLLLLLCFALHSMAQKSTASISGLVYSDSTGSPLAGATVSLLASDSSLEAIGITDTTGSFRLDRIRPGMHLLFISEVNHLTYSQQLLLNQDLAIDTIHLPVRSNSMAAIIITRQLAPVLIRPDTIEFNAAAFKTRENDMVEDLLKKLPGIEVGRDGSILAHGEKVTQVLVDGKPFFGNDPKTATQNLPADIIDKVQLIDRKSEQAQVTRVDDGQVDKVINITIKKNKKRGSFGRAYAGYGTSGRYEARANANHFYDARKMAFIAGSNNTGRSDYSTGQNQESSSYNNSNGVNRDDQARFTYSDRWGKKFDYSFNLALTSSDNMTSQSRYRQNITGDSVNYYDDQSELSRKRKGMQGGVSFEYKPDSLTRIRVNQSAAFYRMDNSSLSSYLSKTQNRKLNEGKRNYTSRTLSPYANGILTISHGFRKQGRGVFLNFSNNSNKSQTDGINQSDNFFYPQASPEYERSLDQSIYSDNHSSALFSSLSYNEPLSSKSSLSLSIGYNNTVSATSRETRDLDFQTGHYDIFNDSLSNHFRNATINKTAGINFSYSLKKGTVSLGTNWQSGLTRSRSVENDSIYQQRFQGLVPYFRFNHAQNGRSVNFGYNFSTRPPQPYQLQAVIDNTNPLYLRLGNPGLKFSSIHHLNFTYNYYNKRKFWSMNTNLSYNAIRNNISNSTVYDRTTGVQTTMPVNLSGVYNFSGRFYLNIPVKCLGNRNSIFGSITVNTAENASLQDHERNNSHSTTIASNTGMLLQVKDVASFSLAYNVNIQQVDYSLRPEQGNRTVARGLNMTMNLMPNRLSELLVSWAWDRNTGSMSGFNRNSHIINADLTQYMNRKKSWWLKLKVYDLLQQNINVYRYSGDSYLEDVRTNILTRYFLLSVNLKLSRFGK